jgi:tRNA-modifying protein YgfZ
MSAVIVDTGPDQGAIWHFGDPVKEQRALAEGRAWADLSHRSVITIKGKDRLTWLHDLTTQHLTNLGSGQWTEALILDPQGHIEHQFELVDDGTQIWMHTEREKAADLISYLKRMQFMLDVEVTDVSHDYAVLKIPGLTDIFGGPYEIVERIHLPSKMDELNAQAMQVGMWAIEAERVAQGRARLLFETDHKSIPNELMMLEKSVHLQKGCYRGQETVAKIHNLGAPPRRLTLLHLDGTEVALPSAKSPVMHDGKEVGFIGTTARHHELGPIALAVIKRNVPLDATLTAESIPANQVEIK